MDILTRHLQAMADAVDFPYMDRWLEDYIDIPIVAMALYLVLVHVVSNTFMKNRPAYNLRTLNIVWNLFLSLFSFVGACYCVPRLYELVTAPAISGLEPSSLRYVANMTPAMRRNIVIPPGFREGVDAVSVRGSLDTSMCVFKDDMYRRNISGLLCLVFMFSKIPEMLDTAFLVFQKKPVIFLHWYHHVTVMLYCWHAWMSPTSSGLWFVSMNYSVHSIMYFYYFVAACGYSKLVRPVAPLITFLQIAQMVVGSIIAVYVFYMDQLGGGCDCRSSNAKLALMMYVSYFILFSNFFRSRYMKKKPKSTSPSTRPVRLYNDCKKYE
ncbi:putative fatty acid elongase [Leishmania major strain Friedlin]|uniref:Elongation of fatty acids protein n=1 Tax=Leishmania major TaxID=5664 RepID=Q4QFR3_LEIMA|nr:putative fatty acid elongase [Leishmania major strain Friedlin]CAG9571259.1 fatty_acid_elongase_-_putative [Leishmania major strain Friedlin]CAJ03013.1 putative fatty acid elongase [Leishmania major strain Friedlin]|eukprot:XP_001687671.1 putative fatty acid elongase [Leishmania major strain Friedlin]